MEMDRVEIAKLELKPGDLLVLMTQRVLSDEQAKRKMDRTRSVLREAGYPDTKVLLLDDGTTLATIAQVAAKDFRDAIL